MKFLQAVLVCLSLAVHADSQSIQGPTLGFANDSGGVIRPIIGIPGASILGSPVNLDSGAIDGGHTIISPKQDYALAMRREERQVVVVGLAQEQPIWREIDGLRPGADVVGVSPNGTAAAVYYASSKTVQLIRGLPGSSAVTNELDASFIAGTAVDVGVSDDGAIVLVKFNTEEGSEFWVISASASQRIGWGRTAAAAFFPDRHDVVMTEDGSSTLMITDVEKAAIRVPLLSMSEPLDGIAGFSNVVVSGDGRKVYLADATSGTIVVVDMETREQSLLRCDCNLKGLYRLKGNALIRLNDFQVLDASSDEPRILVIPPGVNGAENE